jgi:protein-L-isoaspartate(D-aspartate) O-methyltransferase
MSDEQDRGASLRATMVRRLADARDLGDPRVCAAMLQVPRHMFLPGVGLDEAYADNAVVTRYRDGLPVSSASQPAIVAVMLEQLNPPIGGSVLEIGAGTGYNAALLAALVGPSGRVVTIDIDPEVAAEATHHLSKAGVANVEVICGDGASGWPERAPYDAIIVTAGASDLSPEWLSQLAPAGRLVVPLSIRGVQHCVTFVRADCHLRSAAVCEAGFMPLTGTMANADIRLAVPGHPGVHVIAAPGTQVDAELIAGGLDARKPAVPLGITASEVEAFGSLRRWLAFRDRAAAALLYSGPEDGARRSGVPPVVEIAIGGNVQLSSPCLLGAAGFAVLDVVRRGSGACGSGQVSMLELAVRACGFADDEVTRLAELVKTWDAAKRPGADRLQIDAYPSGAAVPEAGGTVHSARHMSFVVSSW